MWARLLDPPTDEREVARLYTLSAEDLVLLYLRHPGRVLEAGEAPPGPLLAYAARQLGFGDIPLICARELEIAGSMPRVVRMMAHIETDLPRADLTHCYLHGAAALRKDLTRTREVPDGD